MGIFYFRFLMVLLLGCLCRAEARGDTAKRRPSLIREERTIVVDGVTERWYLEWKSPPKPFCAPVGGEFQGEEEDGAAEVTFTCPCAGFAYGETSDELTLVRVRPGSPEERLPLAHLFRNYGSDSRSPALQQKPQYDGDIEIPPEDLPDKVKARPTVQIMEFKDYTHDGLSAEFLLQVGAGPCAKKQAILVGLERREMHLHAIGTAKDPGNAVVLSNPDSWEKVRQASFESEVELIEEACGEHGSETESRLKISFSASGLRAVRREFECTHHQGVAGKLIREQEL